MQWLAIIFWLYLNHFKSDFEGVKGKGLLFTQLIKFNYLPTPIYKTQCTKLNLLKQISVGTKPNMPIQIYGTQFTNPKLKMTAMAVYGRAESRNLQWLLSKPL